MATAGSDFARTIRRELISRNCNYFDAEPAPAMLPPQRHDEFGFGQFSARYGRIPTVAQLRQLAERAFGLRTFEETIWESDGRFYDVFRPVVEPNGYVSAEEVGHCRDSHLRNVRRLFEEAHVLVFALGRTEAWRSRADGLVHPMRPGTVAGTFDPETYEHVVFAADDVVADFEAFMAIVRGANPDIKFILTDSPASAVEMTDDRSGTSATNSAREVLRTAAETLRARYDCIDYLRTGEPATSSDVPFAVRTGDGRLDEDLEMAMDAFFSEHGEGSVEMLAGAEDPALRLAREAAEMLMARQQEICDDLMTEAAKGEDREGPS
ncbi:GSCFA domain-containing protein [Microbaculum marinum]|uniref:GSCFA domain-containing protein n=1 Tax=Microbaculum marinum TaxID=1764581 RepID=A0AAW9RQ62_9HYPH